MLSTLVLTYIYIVDKPEKIVQTKLEIRNFTFLPLERDRRMPLVLFSMELIIICHISAWKTTAPWIDDQI